VAIIQAVWEHRFVNSEQLETLFPGHPINLRKRLQKLFLLNYLDRPEQQKHQWGWKPLIYALGQKGAQLLAELYKEPVDQLDWTEKNRTATFPFFDHALMVSDFMIALTCACQLKPDVTLLRWTTNQNDLRHHVSVNKEARSLTPDGFFLLHLPDGNIPYFVEADRGTMTLERYLTKLRRYFVWWHSGAYTKVYGFPHFRLLTISRTPERRDHLVEIAKHADDEQKGFRGFWFATNQDFSRTDPLTLFTPIWRNPRDQDFFSLVD
jgi:hypothetical protein